ncbi:hypothetical protein CRG98_000666, partial [Punica granatum]
MGVTRSGRIYENPAAKDKGKAPAAEVGAEPESSPFLSKKVTEEEAEAFMKIVKASKYKVVEQMAKSPAHVSLLALLLGSEPHREALLRVLTAAQVPKGTSPDRIEETVGSIFSNAISFSDDELPSEGKLLGFVVSEHGIEVDPDKVKAIKELPPPSTVREVRGFLGWLNYIARFIANLTDKCQPLFRLLRENAAMEWDHECQKAFDTIKAYLIRPPILRLRQYTLYHTIRLLSKADPLRYLLDSPSSMRNIAKWRCQLTEYDIEYVPRTSVKGQAIANHLAEFPINDDTPINTDFSDEGILQVDKEKEEPTWKMYFDEAVNSVGSGVGAVLISPDGRQQRGRVRGVLLRLASGDRFQGEGVRDAKLVPYHEYLEKLAKNFEKISFTYTPRAKNQFADALATLASMASISEGNIIEPLEIEVAKGPAHCNAIEASEAKPWYEDIRNFLQTGQYSPFADRRDRQTLKRLATHYFLSGEILYRRSFDSTLLRCIDEHESRRLMEEVHGGNCGPHMNGLMLAKKIMRLGYYWSTMETDCWIEAITLASVTAKAVARFLRRDVIARYE